MENFSAKAFVEKKVSELREKIGKKRCFAPYRAALTAPYAPRLFIKRWEISLFVYLSTTGL